MSETKFEKTPWGSLSYTDRDGDTILVRKSHDGQLLVDVNDEVVIVPIDALRQALNEIYPPKIAAGDLAYAARATTVQVSPLEEQGFEDLLADTLNAVLDEREARKAEEEDRIMRAFAAGRSL